MFLNFIYNNERVIKYIFQLSLSFFCAQIRNHFHWKIDLWHSLTGNWMNFCISCVIYDDRPGNKKLINMNWSDRRQHINLVFAQNSTFCACAGVCVWVVLKRCHKQWKLPQIYFFVDSLCIIGGYLTNHVCLFCYFDSCVWRPIWMFWFAQTTCYSFKREASEDTVPDKFHLTSVDNSYKIMIITYWPKLIP